MSTVFLPKVTLIDLGPGAQIVLYGFRAVAFGQTKCGCLAKVFERSFGRYQGGEALRVLKDLTNSIGHKGLRKFKVAPTRCKHLTQDEASLLSALSAAQDEDPDRAQAHLSWLLARPPTEYEETLVFDMVEYFSIQGLEINTPENGAQFSTIGSGKTTMAPVTSQVGNA